VSAPGEAVAASPDDVRPDGDPTPAGKRPGLIWWALAAGGVLLLGVLVWQAGPRQLLAHVRSLGPWAPLVLMPYAVAAAFDAAGWAATFARRRPSFALLYVVRVVGEALNNVTPTAYLGGEPVKAYLLRRFGVPLAEGVASVILAKTALTIAQIAFVILGIALYCLRDGVTTVDVALFGAAALAGAAVIALLIRWQQRGLVASIVALGRRVFPRARLLDRLAARADEIDQRLHAFYSARPAAAVASVVLHLAGWIAGAGEVWVIMLLIGHPVSWIDALIIEALAQPARLVGVVVPATIGVQEAGGMIIFSLLGLAPELGLTLMLLKRVREIVYSLLGLVIMPRLRPRQPVPATG
jgi:glycosyltransferase 2 family protein